MKKHVGLMMSCLIFAVGCGGQKPQAKQQEFKGTEVSRDYIAQGMKFLGEADIQRAIHSFDQAIEADPKNADNYLVLGQVYLRLKQYGRAADTFLGATRVAPNNGEAYYLLATSLALNDPGNRQPAIEAAQKGVEVFMQQKDEERFKRTLVLLRSLVGPESVPAPQTPAKVAGTSIKSTDTTSMTGTGMEKPVVPAPRVQ